MKIQACLILSLVLSSATVFAQDADTESTTQPIVSTRVMVCNQWRRFDTGAGVVAWTCLKQPQEVILADGEKTDLVIKSLQDQINELRARLEVSAKP